MPNLHYHKKIILAPMVRAGTLPLRLLALDYGADIVYCEELIDWKLIRSIRKVNDALGTIDYVDQTDGTIVFRTCVQERNKVVLQIGTCCPERALSVAMKVKDDVAAIDVNMGCPKEFSIKGGMGAALLSQPDLACKIVSVLSSNLSIPVTCKIRVLSSVNDTIEFCKRLEASGVSAIAIHGRRIDERPQHRNRNEEIAAIAQSLSVPIIANGGSKDITCYDDIEKFRLECGASSVMLARVAQKDCTIFKKPDHNIPSGTEISKESKCTEPSSVSTDVRWMALEPLIKDYLKYAVRYSSPAPNAKYCIQAMLKDLQDTPLGKKFLEAQTLMQICEIWGLGEFCRTTEEQQRVERDLQTSDQAYVPKLITDVSNGSKNGVDFRGHENKRMKTDEEDKGDGREKLVELNVSFLRSLYKEDRDLPKTQLLVETRRKNLPQPKYWTQKVDKLFRSEVLFDGCKYTSTYWEKNKRAAEQGAALACLISNGIVEPSDHMLTHRTRF